MTRAPLAFVNTSGVTLLELVLVMVVIFVLAGIVAPRFSDTFPALQVRTAADRIFAWAQKARADAALTGARQRLVFSLADGRYWIEVEARPLKEPGVFTPRGGAWGEEALPSNVMFGSLEGLDPDEANSALRVLEFRPDGTSVDAAIVVANDRGDRRTLRVEGATSRVSIEVPSQP